MPLLRGGRFEKRRCGRGEKEKGEIRDTGYEIRDTRYEIRDTGYGIRDTGYGLVEWADLMDIQFANRCWRRKYENLLSGKPWPLRRWLRS